MPKRPPPPVNAPSQPASKAPRPTFDALHPMYRTLDISPTQRWTIYLSGPMTGIPALNFPAFEVAAAQLRHAGHRVLSPHESAMDGRAPWDAHLRADLALLLRATAVATLPHAAASRGARLECMVAAQLGMPIAPVHDWLDFDRELPFDVTPPTLGAPL